MNDIRGFHVTQENVVAAIRNSRGGPMEEGSVGAGTGTVAFGWKGGIGTSSRKLPATLGGYTVGVLVQTNFGGVLTIAGAPVGKELGQYYLRDAKKSRQGRRVLAARAWLGMARGQFCLKQKRRLRDCILHGTPEPDSYV